MIVSTTSSISSFHNFSARFSTSVNFCTEFLSFELALPSCSCLIFFERAFNWFFQLRNTYKKKWVSEINLRLKISTANLLFSTHRCFSSVRVCCSAYLWAEPSSHRTLDRLERKLIMLMKIISATTFGICLLSFIRLAANSKLSDKYIK